MSSKYRVICDRTDKKLYRSECVREWNGLLVWKDVVDPYPERLLAPNTLEDLSVTETRSEGVDTFSVPDPNDL